MPTLYDIICLYCGKPASVFTNPGQRFCSHKCYNDSRRVEFKCRGCGSAGSSKASEPRKFCSQSCAATLNNTKRISNPKTSKSCTQCGDQIKRAGKKFCSSQCSGDALHSKRVVQWAAGATPSDGWLRHELLRTRGHACEVCKETQWMGSPIPLQLDHINGDSRNGRAENIRLICPNCHAQTPTYMSKNKGRGRHARMKRYHAGKSY